MTTLIANLSSGKGTWGHVSRLIQEGEFDKVLLVTNEFGRDTFKKDDKSEFLLIDHNGSIDDMKAVLEPAFSGLEGDIKLNIISGSGKEHMAVLITLMKLGKKFTFTALTKEGVTEF